MAFNMKVYGDAKCKCSCPLGNNSVKGQVTLVNRDVDFFFNHVSFFLTAKFHWRNLEKSELKKSTLKKVLPSVLLTVWWAFFLDLEVHA